MEHAAGERAVAPPLAVPGALVGPAVDDVLEVDVDGCLTLYQRTAPRVLVLNRTATDVWRLGDGTRDETAIVDALARSYGTDAAEIADEVGATIRRFVEEGFLGLTLR
jgi:hypothetical protein